MIDLKPEHSSGYAEALEHALGRPFFLGNQINVLKNGVEIFPAMLKSIKSAEKKIEFLTYVYWAGDVGRQFAEALAARARKGVTVRVLLDAYGAKSIEDENISLMQDAGVDLRWFRPLATWRIWRSDKRTHRKILICDHQVGYIGGVGIADEWQGDANNPSQWRDTHLRLFGSCLNGLHAAFKDNWNEAGTWTTEDKFSHSFSQRGSTAVQVVKSSATVGWTEIASMVRCLIDLAKENITITTAYFVPDEIMVERLCAAVDRGVKVSIMTNGRHTDSRLSQLVGQSSYESLLEAGAKLFLYNQTLLHAKVLTVDNQISCVGSANMNRRSLGKDEECSIVALDKTLAGTLNSHFEQDQQHCTALNHSDWCRRGEMERLKERLATIVAEQL